MLKITRCAFKIENNPPLLTVIQERIIWKHQGGVACHVSKIVYDQGVLFVGVALSSKIIINYSCRRSNWSLTSRPER